MTKKTLNAILLKMHMDTVINVVPNADISKTHKIMFFQLYQKYPFLHPKILSGYILGVVRNHPVQKIGVF